MYILERNLQTHVFDYKVKGIKKTWYTFLSDSQINTYVHYSASNFMAPYSHKFYEVVQKMHKILCKLSIIIKIDAPSSGLFGKNLVSNIFNIT